MSHSEREIEKMKVGSYWWIVYWVKEVWASWIGTRSTSPDYLPVWWFTKRGAAPKNFQNPNFRIYVNTVFLDFLTPVQQEQADQLHPKNFGMLEGSNYTFENWDDGGGRKWDKYFTMLVYIAHHRQASWASTSSKLMVKWHVSCPSNDQGVERAEPSRKFWGADKIQVMRYASKW